VDNSAGEERAEFGEEPDGIAAALAFALRFEGQKRIRNAD
jgi:hypothetical protein